MIENSPEKLIRLSKSCLSRTEKQAVMDVLDREYLGMGSEVGLFEKALSEYLGRPSVCVVNGTAALHLAIQACECGPGDEVLVPSLTYVATFQAVRATGAKPIACDIDPETGLLDLKDAEKRLTSRTRAMIPVHYMGGVGDLESLYSFAKRYQLRVIEDAAHAFGTLYHQKRVGSFGDITCFSFDGIKNITSGEGGCIVTDDPQILSKIQDARLLGVEKDTEKRLKGMRSWEFDVTSQGWRYHMSNIMAAIGLEQLKRFPQLASARQRLAQHYESLLKDHPRIALIRQDYTCVVPHIYVIRIRNLQNRRQLQDLLIKKGIQTGVHYQPNHTLTLFQDPGSAPLPGTESFYREILTLPLHPDLSLQDVQFVCSQLQDLIGTT